MVTDPPSHRQDRLQYIAHWLRRSVITVIRHRELLTHLDNFFGDFDLLLWRQGSLLLLIFFLRFFCDDFLTGRDRHCRCGCVVLCRRRHVRTLLTVPIQELLSLSVVIILQATENRRVSATCNLTSIQHNDTHLTQASSDRECPLCRQRHLSNILKYFLGYRSRTRSPNPNLKP